MLNWHLRNEYVTQSTACQVWTQLNQVEIPSELNHRTEILSFALGAHNICRLQIFARLYLRSWPRWFGSQELLTSDVRGIGRG